MNNNFDDELEKESYQASLGSKRYTTNDYLAFISLGIASLMSFIALAQWMFIKSYFNLPF